MDPWSTIKRDTLISFSLISQEKMPGFSFLYSSILASTSGVATRGFEPPITPGRIDPVSYRVRVAVLVKASKITLTLI